MAAAILKSKKSSPLKSVFDSPQLSGSSNVQDGGIASFPEKKKLWIALQNTPVLRASLLMLQEL